MRPYLEAERPSFQSVILFSRRKKGYVVIFVHLASCCRSMSLELGLHVVCPWLAQDLGTGALRIADTSAKSGNASDPVVAKHGAA